MSTSNIYFYSDNINNTLEIIPTNCSLEAITEPTTGPTNIDNEPVYDSSGNLINNDNNNNGPGNPYNDYPYNSNSYYKTKYTISGLNNSSTIEIINTNGFYYVDLNNWIEESNNGSTLTFSYSTNPALSVINSVEKSIHQGLYDVTAFLDNGLTSTSRTLKKSI